MLDKVRTPNLGAICVEEQINWNEKKKREKNPRGSGRI